MAGIKEVLEVPKEMIRTLPNKVRRGRPRIKELLSLLEKVTNLNGSNVLRVVHDECEGKSTKCKLSVRLRSKTYRLIQPVSILHEKPGILYLSKRR